MDTQIQRAILYYPTIEIGNPNWIKQSVLYWDIIGTIAPRGLEWRAKGVPEFNQLADHGMLRIFHPESYVQNQQQLLDEFIRIRNSKKYKTLCQEQKNAPAKYKLHSEKMYPQLKAYIRENHLADEDGDVFLLNKIDGLLYMSLLAKYIADQDGHTSTIPGTDYREYRDLAFISETKDNSISALSLSLQKVLPIPRVDVPLQNVLAFKKKRRDELLEFRKTITDLQAQLKVSQTHIEIQDRLASFSENMELGVSNLIRVASEDKLPTVLGTLESLFSISVPDVVSIVAGAAINPAIAVIGIAGSGAVKVGKYLIDKSNEHRKSLNKDTYSYIYHAQQEGII